MYVPLSILFIRNKYFIHWDIYEILQCMIYQSIIIDLFDTVLYRIPFSEVIIPKVHHDTNRSLSKARWYLILFWSYTISFSLIYSLPANGLRSFLLNSSLCLTKEKKNPFSNGFPLNCNFTLSEEHSTEFDAFNIYVLYLVTTVFFEIQMSPFSWWSNCSFEAKQSCFRTMVK